MNRMPWPFRLPSWLPWMRPPSKRRKLYGTGKRGSARSRTHTKRRPPNRAERRRRRKLQAAGRRARGHR